MKEMFAELKPFKKAIVLLFAAVIGSTAANLALPMYLSRVINEAIPRADMPEIAVIGGKMVFFVLVGTACSIGMGLLSARVSTGVAKNLRSKVFRKVQYFSGMEFDRFSASSLITRTNGDVLQIQTFVNMTLRISLMAPIMCVGGIVMALLKSRSMSMILLVSMPVMTIFIFLIAKRAMPLSTIMQQKLDEINLVIREKLTGIRTARTFGTEEYEEERFEKVNREFMKNSIRMNSIMALLMPGLNLILYATTVALTAFAGYRIVSGSEVPIGDLIAVVQYVMQIMMSVIMLSMIFILYPRTAVSAGRVNEILEAEPLIRSEAEPVTETEKRAALCFRNVGFRFPGAQTPALQDISFESGPGEITAIIGSTGCGKSTLVNLIPRFYDVSEGEILVDGVDVRKLDLAVLRAKIGLVPQKAFLFEGTAAENVSYGAGACSEEKVKEAVKIAQSYDFVMEKEGGFESRIAQGGANLSGGQRQRLSIARAICREPEIYIFDDSFSALDFKTDAALRRELFARTKDATVILVAQRVSTIREADRILVLENGRCVGQGTHEELLRFCEVYQEIVSSQRSREEVQG